MKQLLTTAFLFACCLFSFGQTQMINLSGHVENTDGTSMEGINIHIETDSSAFWPGYINDVLTDENGNYTDAFEGLSQGAVWITMEDCNNNEQTIQTYYAPNNTTIVTDFVYCDLSNACSVNIVLDSLQGAGQGLYAAVAYTGGISYIWSTGEATQDIFVSQSGTYCVTIMDSEGCSDSDCIYVDLDTSNCSVAVFNTPTGLSASGQGTAPFSYFWNTGETTQSIAPTSTGTYCLTLTDTNGCTSSDCIFFSNQQDSTCHVFITQGQGNDPDILGAIGSGSAPFSYLWNNGATTATIGGTSPGTYCVTLTDADGCTASDCHTVVSNDPDNYNLSGSLFLTDSTQIVPLSGTVYLFSVEQNNIITLVDSTDFSATPIGASYSFGDVTAGSYIVLATLSADSPEFNDYLPTYYGNVLWWDEATILHIPYLGWSSFDIIFIEGNMPEGPGFIGGSVVDMGFTSESPTDRDDPLFNASIILLDDSDEPLAHTKTDAEGGFEFANVAWGTYKVYLEIPGIDQQFVEVTIGPNNPEVRDIEFEVEEGTVTSTIELEKEKKLSVYPNPAKEQLQIRIENAIGGTAELTILDTNGKPQANYQFNVSTKSQIETLDISRLTPGIYFLSLNQGGKVSTVRFVRL